MNDALPRRIAGNLALDLANTISWRGTARATDHLRDADAVLAWAKDAALVGEDFRLAAAKQAALVKDVHALRHAVYGAFAAIAQARVPAATALQAIRDVAAHGLASATLVNTPATLRFAGVDRITGAVAWAALDLLRSDELARLKQCPAEDCRWLFLDRTKNGSRRWCEMASCGDRAKKANQR
jgi:predicted RNA-binding Zn ribbon-like protein